MPDLLNLDDKLLAVQMLGRANLVNEIQSRTALLTETGLDPQEFDLTGNPHSFAVLLIDFLVEVDNRDALVRILDRIAQRFGAVTPDLQKLRRALGANPAPEVPGHSPATPVPGGPIADSLAELTSLTATDPEIKEAAMRFRKVFESACSRIADVDGFKALHDRLHELRDKCIDPMTKSLDSFPKDDGVKTEFDEYRIEFEDINQQLRAIAAGFPTADTSWMSYLESGLADLRMSLDTADAPMLKQVLIRVDRELGLRLPQVNHRLNAAAGVLMLNDLIDALREICDHGDRIGIDAGILARIRSGVEVLERMARTMEQLVSLHDKWQDLDDYLRQIASNLTPRDVGYYLSDLAAKVLVVSQQAAETWAGSFQSDFQGFSGAAQSSSADRLNHSFRLVRRQVKIRFYNTDADLKKQCDQLLSVGNPLAVLLKELV